MNPAILLEAVNTVGALVLKDIADDVAAVMELKAAADDVAGVMVLRN